MTMDRGSLLRHLLLLLLSLAPQQLGTCRASSTSAVRCHAPERNALIDFKQSVGDPSGRLSSWVGQDCCAWEGVGCNNLTGHVIQLNLRNRRRSNARGECSDESYWVFDEYGCRWALYGGISPSLLSLPRLRHLDLSGNYFQHNAIPEFLGSLTELTYLNLSRAALKGQVPDKLGNLSKLHHLDLSYNFYMVDDLTASPGLHIEDAGWISRLTSLRHLNMERVNFRNASNWLEAANALPRIQELWLANCEIVSFPPHDSLLRLNFTSLTTLDLSFNGLNSSIPNWLLNITSLEELYLGGNSLNWLDLASISKLASLRVLDLSANKFQNGFKPAALSKLCDLQTLVLSGVPIKEVLTDLEVLFSASCLGLSLEELELGSTQLSGFLPDWLVVSMKNMKHLDLSGNSLYGPLPASLGSLSSPLQHLDISHNRLNGTVAEGTFRHMDELVHLGLAGNSLTLSEMHLADLPKLKYLDISFNTLVLNESHEEWIPPFQLETLYMSSCRILPKPQFPKWFRTQRNLSALHLSKIGIKDIFPTWLPTNLQDLVLSHNEITGQIPQYLSKLRSLVLINNSLSGQLPSDINDLMPTLDLLDLSMNNLSGGVPLSICRIKHLIILRLFKNNLFGKLPNCWENSTKIFLLDLSNNKFQGGIPGSLCNMGMLRALHLSHNNLSGQIPTCLRGCTRLVRLDIGHNQLSGNIPSWIAEDLLGLHVLSLRSNAFMGNISSQFSKLEYLQVLDLSNNYLSGVIPSSFGDFKGLKGYPINDYSNLIQFDGMWLFMKGSELEYADLLQYVRFLDLSNNCLSGQIPKKLGNLNLLQSLNLSYNYLIEEIPTNIDEMQQLEALDLSRNNLTGLIPSSLASLNFLGTLNLSYNNLSGKIPTGSQLQTFGQSSYIGNPNLCGFPLKNCTNNIINSDEEAQKEDNDKNEVVWLFASISLGFITGFWMFYGALIFQRRWRSIFFRAIDNMHEKLNIMVAVNMAKLRRE